MQGSTAEILQFTPVLGAFASVLNEAKESGLLSVCSFHFFIKLRFSAYCSQENDASIESKQEETDSEKYLRLLDLIRKQETLYLTV